MGLLPIRVLLLSGGEPSFFDEAGHSEGLSDSPFLQIDTVESLPSFQALESGPWQLCVLSCETYLSSSAFPQGLPAIVYGPSPLALRCLEAGACDFMRPGWSWLELEARLFRYWSPVLKGDMAVYHLWGLTLVKLNDFQAGGSSANTEPGLKLSPREATALRLLTYRAGRVLSYLALYNHGVESPRAGLASSKAAAAMMMSRLKKKLAIVDPGLARCLRSARGQGYLWIEGRLREN